MSANLGTIYIADLPFQATASANTVGLQNLATEAQARASYSDQLASKVISALSSPTTLQEMQLGASGGGLEVVLGELDKAPSNHAKLGGRVGFPLWKLGQTLSWTRDAWLAKTASDLLREVDQAIITHNRTKLNAVRNSLFNDTNYNFTDALTNGGTVAVKRLINADSDPIPDSPAGTAFDPAVHSHYIARVSTLARTDVTKVITLVSEHGLNKGMALFINASDMSAIAALTYDGSTNQTGFVALLPSQINVPSTVATATGALDVSDSENIQIGMWVSSNGATPIFVASWVPQYYVLAAVTNEADKVLGMRERGDVSGLNVVAVEDVYPTHVIRYESVYGLGVLNRAGAAILYLNSTSWANPTLTGGPKAGAAGDNLS